MSTNSALADEYIAFKKSKKQYVSIIRQFSKETSKPLKECKAADIEGFLTNHVSAATTWNTWLSALRQYYAWLYNRESGKPIKKWKVPNFFEYIDWKENRNNYRPEDMWVEEEILMAINTQDHPRDKAMIAVGWDLGPRPIEILDLYIRNIVLKENHAICKLTDHSNPEGRGVALTISYPYLLTWLNCHPLKNDPNAPLWVRLEGTPRKIGYTALRYLCSVKLKKELGHKIHKPFNPYCMFCHSRLTNLVETGFTEYELKRFRGWSMNSTMPARYIHMLGIGVNEKLLDKAGIKKLDKQKESVLNPKECYRCKHQNPADAKYCVKCNFVLTREAVEEEKLKEVKMQETLQQVTKGMESIQQCVADFRRIKDWIFLCMPESAGKADMIREVEQRLQLVETRNK